MGVVFDHLSFNVDIFNDPVSEYHPSFLIFSACLRLFLPLACGTYLRRYCQKVA